MTNTKKHPGSCHCGAIKFEVEIDATTGSRCNCSICTKVHGIGGIAKPDALVVLAGESALSSYVWGGNVSTRYFCKVCGVHCFQRGHLAELGGDFVGVYLNTLDDVDPATIELVFWDGRHDNWEGGPRKTPWPLHGSAARAQTDASTSPIAIS